MSKLFQIISPANGELYAERSYADEKMVRDCLNRSAKAFQNWRLTPLEKRRGLCTLAVGYFKEHADEWGKEITMQMGRPIRYTPDEISSGFAERAEHMISIADGALKSIDLPQKQGFRRYIKKEPLGTVLVLSPWNYPYLTAVNAVIPALMAGNCVILKHADQTALCAERYLEAFQYAGLPEGVFQYLHITHKQVAEVIGDSSIKHVAFTGSEKGGRAVQKAARRRFISAGLELGGKDPAYIAKDADISYSAEGVAEGAFFNSGQSCCGIERVYVHKNIYDEFLEKLVEVTKNYRLGDPLKPETTLGPMVRKSNAEKADNEIRRAIEQGAKPLIGFSDFPDLSYPLLAPQILVNVDHTMNIMQNEMFAPAIGVMSVESDEKAIRLMNDSPYGLTASVWTRDPERAVAIGDKIETGTWFMNRCDYLDPALAWSGVKNSGRGCTLSVMGYDYLTRPKSYHLKMGPQ